MRMQILASGSLAGLVATAATASPVLNGSRDASYGSAVAVQTVDTGFGDNFSELNAAYAQIEGGVLYLLLTGNLENNFNKLNIFIDSVAGGQNQINPAAPIGDNPTNDGWADKHAGMRFDAGFEANYLITIRNGFDGVNNRFDVDFATLGGGAGAFEAAGNVFGGSLTGSNINALPGAGIGVAFDNSNTGGIGGGDGPADQAAALAVTTGIELAIPLSSIGSPIGAFKVSAMINGSNHDYLSNQFLGGLAAGTGNLGGDGTGGYNGTVSQIDLGNFAGNQYFVVPEPASLSLLALGALALVRRR